MAEVARKLGAKPRTFDPTMPHMMSVRMMAGPVSLPPVPDHLNLMDHMPEDLGMMLNDRLGCCTCATAYHMGQVWSYHGRDQTITQPDRYVEQMYREFAGYNGTPPTDQGAVIQSILRQWLTKGIPIQQGTENNPAPGRSYIRAAMEVLPRRPGDVKRAIYDCGGLYIGFDTPAWLMREPRLPDFWDQTGRSPDDTQTIGGHAVSCHGYDDRGVWLISWGRKYQMSWDMFREVVGEAYALIHPWWIEATGQTPFGLPVDQLADQMQAFCQRHVGPPRL